jgi:hypothetical protein
MVFPFDPATGIGAVARANPIFLKGLAMPC